MASCSLLHDLEGLAQDMARLEMDRDSCDIVFVVSSIVERFLKLRLTKIYPHKDMISYQAALLERKCYTRPDGPGNWD